MMKEKILRHAITLAGILCFLIYLGSRFLPLMNVMLVEKMDTELQEFTTYGDLYYYNCISHFRGDYPEQIRRYRLSDKNPNMEESDLLTFGDSFFDVSFQRTLPERIADTTGLKVYSYITQDPWNANPFCILNTSSLEREAEPRVFIFETVERNISKKFSEPYDAGCQAPFERYQGFGEKLLNEFIFKSNDEQLFNLMLKRSWVTHSLYSLFSTIKFDLFGTISSMTPEYTLEPEPWLFYANSIDDGPGTFYYDYTREEIETYAANIAHLSRELKRVYNLDMVFMLIPNKYSLYNDKVNQDTYNGFVPALQEELDRVGVRYIDLYNPFKDSDQVLYYGTDTHWNKDGVDLALELTLSALKQQLFEKTFTQQINLQSQE
jgi:hypothetical protein